MLTNSSSISLSAFKLPPSNSRPVEFKEHPSCHAKIVFGQRFHNSRVTEENNRRARESQWEKFAKRTSLSKRIFLRYFLRDASKLNFSLTSPRICVSFCQDFRGVLLSPAILSLPIIPSQFCSRYLHALTSLRLFSNIVTIRDCTYIQSIPDTIEIITVHTRVSELSRIQNGARGHVIPCQSARIVVIAFARLSLNPPNDTENINK